MSFPINFTSVLGKGLAFEVLTQVIQDGLNFLNIESIVAETQTANKASCRLLEKLGMKNVQMLERFGQEQAVYELSKNNDSIRQIIALSGGGFLSRTFHLSMSTFYDKLRKMNELKFVLFPQQVMMRKGISRSFMRHSIIVMQPISCKKICMIEAFEKSTSATYYLCGWREYRLSS